MAKKGSIYKKYSPEFKISCIMDMRNNYLSYRETVRKYWNITCREKETNYTSQIKSWERIYLEQGVAGFYKKRHGTEKMYKPKKPTKQVKEDLISENKRLKQENEYFRAEIEYLKKLDALIRAEEQKKNKKH